MKGLSYVQKTVIPYLILLAISLASVGIATARFFDQFVLENWEKELTSEARLISEQLPPVLANFDSSSDISPLAKKFMAITGYRTTIILPDGKVIGETDYPVSEMENHLTRPEVQAALQGTPLPTIRMSSTLRERFIYVAVPIKQDNKVIGIVRLAKSLQAYDQTVKKFRTLFFMFAGFSLLISLIFMVLQSTRWLNPLRKISEKIYASTEGELRVIEGKERRDEIGLVVAAHNAQVEKSKRQIQALQNERTKLSAILFNMTDGVILVNSEGVVTLINPTAEKIFSVSMEPIHGDTLIEVVRQHQIVELWQQTLQTGKSQSITIQTSMEKDSIQVISSLLGPILPGEVLLLVQDLTLLHKLETVRKDFISNISHELRTPLASLKALSETLQSGALQDPTVSNRFLHQMDEEIDNLTQMVQELLELSKIESGKVPLEKKSCSISEIVTGPVERMRMQAERAGIMLELTLTEHLPDVEVDRPRIQQVFVNLIHNAIKFTPPGGSIKVSAAQQDQFIHFSIEDTGVGIPPTDLKRIFERFYKTDPSRSSGGTGLGLSISKHIVEAHGGKIWVDSMVGSGSTFTFSIPISPNLPNHV